ncbi:hypothetical protein E2542_SST03671 [Spatholobus suberectus]|nr:hypothetical protein E2542_SST03671 [Spatholobus suberectus]
MALMEDNAPSTEALTRKLNEILTETEDDAGQFSFKEETIEKVMQELYKEIIASPSPTPTPSNESLVVQVEPQNEPTGLRLGEEKKGDEDFDDEWLARVLNWGQGQVLDTSDWF